MKKILSLLLCLMLSFGMAFTVVACDDTDPSDTTPPQSTGGSVPDPVTPPPAEEEYTVAGVSQPATIAKYLANAGEQEDETVEFFVKNKTYKVGDDNAFSYKPVVTFLNEELEEVAVENWDYTYTLEEKSGDVYIAAEGMLDGESENYKFDFSDQAVGKTLRLTVKPAELSGEQANDPSYAASLVIDVVDGYNAYNDYDLAYISNVVEVRGLENIEDAQIKNQAGWAAFREAHGLTLNPKDIKAVIMHNDISLTAESVPSTLLYSADEVKGFANAKWLVGTLKDETQSGVYYRVMNDKESFDFIGNYFTLDASEFPYVKQMSGTTETTYDENGNMLTSNVISHASLIRIEGNDNKGLNKIATKASLSDVNVIGNSPKTERKEVQGGLIFLKTEKTDLTANNLLSRCFFITTMGQTVGSKCTFRDMKCYDSFNSPIYNWGCEDMRLDNCIVEGAGGPAIICDVYLDGNGTPVNPRVVATNCVFNNPVEGSEAWFTMALGDEGAQMMIPGIKALNAIPQGISATVAQLNPQAAVNRSFLKEMTLEDGVTHQMFNVYCLVKDDENVAGKKVVMNGENVVGHQMAPYVNINGSVMDYGVGATFFEEPVVDAAHSMTLFGTLMQAGKWGSDVTSAAAPVLESAGRGLAYYTGVQDKNNPLASIGFPRVSDMTDMAQLAPEALSFLQGDAINLYYNTGLSTGMLSIMFEYYTL